MSPNTQTKPVIDYAPLTTPVTDAEFAAYKALSAQTTRFEKIALVVIVTIVLFASLFVFPWPLVDVLQIKGFGVLMALMLWVGTIGAIMYGLSQLIKAADKKAARLFVFATRNNLTFVKDRLDPGYSGMIFDEGHARKITRGYGFPGRAEIGNYVYTTGSGKNKQTHTWGYIKVKLPRRLPHMVLDSKSNNVFGRFSNLTDTFGKDQVLSLEGDFNDYFTLYAPKQYERDALYVFTPDVMAKLIDNGGGFDMEVVDDELFIYKGESFGLGSEAELTKLLSIIDSIGTELSEQTDHYADERVADRAQNIIAPQGMRLKRGINWLSVALFILAAFYIFWPHIAVFFER